MNLNNTILLKLILVFLFFFVVLYSCSGVYQYYRDSSYTTSLYSNTESKNTLIDKQNVSQFREKIIQIANESLDLTSFTYDGKKFLFDCSGFVSYVYYKAGIDLQKYDVGTYTNGVQLIYKISQKYFTLSRITCKPADVIIFDNTYDKNSDGRLNDQWTHIGIVVGIDNDNTVTFIHVDSKGVSKGYINLLNPGSYMKDKKIVNSYLRTYGDNNLAGQLFNTYGALFIE